MEELNCLCSAIGAAAGPPLLRGAVLYHKLNYEKLSLLNLLKAVGE